MSEEKTVTYDLQEILVAAKDKIKARLQDSIIQEINEKLKWKLADDVGDVVDEFVKTELKPEISKYLIEHKIEILQGIQVAIAEAGQIFTKTLVEKLTDQVAKADSWKIKNVLKELF